MWSALVVSVLSLAVAGTPPPRSPELVPPDVAASLCREAAAPPLAEALPDGRAPKAICSATALCSDGSLLSCNGTGPSSTCIAVDSDCANGVRGYVECNGSRQDCPPCPRKFYCDCRLPNGNWGVWDGSQCALKICIIPVQ